MAFCASCGSAVEAGARYCDQCGADLAAVPPPTVPPARPLAAVTAPPPPFLYALRRPRSWWTPLGLWAVLAAPLFALDALAAGRITWSAWPAGLLAIVLVGFPLLNRLEARSLARGARRSLK